MTEQDFAFPGDRVRGGRPPEGPTPELRIAALEAELGRLRVAQAEAARRAEGAEARLATLEPGLAALQARKPPAFGVGALALAALSALVAAAAALGGVMLLGG